MSAIRSTGPYRRRAQDTKYKVADAMIRVHEYLYREALNVASAEPGDVMREEEARGVYETYEALCAKHGVCRHLDCYRRTRKRLCRNHR